MKKVKIFFIYADNCAHCDESLALIESCVEETELDCEILKFSFEEKVAINIARNNNLNDLPCCVIGRRGLQTDGIKEASVMKAIKEAANG